MKDLNHLVERARKGDKQSFWDLAEVYYQDLFCFCRKKMFYKDHKAEDATHDSFIKMMHSVKDLKETTKFKSFCTRLLIQTA